MGIPESQLDTWTKQGSVAQSRDTYASVKTVLEDKNAPFANKNPTMYLQGSYGNDTNVARDSDVDIVAFIETTFAHDAKTLPAEQFNAFERSYPGTASYSYNSYKNDVANWLKQKYSNVRVGKKAIFIPGSGNRRDCDVLAAIEYRYYYRFNSTADQSYAQGICFYLPDGTQIINFPKQHSDNCTSKHQATTSWFKPTVRMYKNMRNYMIDKGQLRDGVAPSYFIEGMLHNVPSDKFGKSYEDTFVGTFNYLANAGLSAFKCANGIHPLISNSSPVSWNSSDCSTFLSALRTLWNNW